MRKKALQHPRASVFFGFCTKIKIARLETRKIAGSRHSSISVWTAETAANDDRYGLRLIRTMKAAPRGDCGFISCAVGMHFLGSEYAELLRSSGSPLSNVNDVYLSNYCGYEAPTSSSLLRKALVQIDADLKFVLVETKKKQRKKLSSRTANGRT